MLEVKKSRLLKVPFPYGKGIDLVEGENLRVEVFTD